jgi:hypothetical protein
VCFFLYREEENVCGVWRISLVRITIKMVLNNVVNPVLKNVAYEMSDWFLGGN